MSISDEAIGHLPEEEDGYDEQLRREHEDAVTEGRLQREREAAQAECDWRGYDQWSASLDAALAREKRLDGQLDSERDAVADMRRGEW